MRFNFDFLLHNRRHDQFRGANDAIRFARFGEINQQMHIFGARQNDIALRLLCICFGNGGGRATLLLHFATTQLNHCGQIFDNRSYAWRDVECLAFKQLLPFGRFNCRLDITTVGLAELFVVQLEIVGGQEFAGLCTLNNPFARQNVVDDAQCLQ